jgi:hypothetical protein
MGRRIMMLLALAALLAVMVGPVAAAEFGAKEPAYVPGEVLVQFKAQTTRATRAAALRDHGGTRLATLNAKGRLVRVKVKAGQSVEDAVAAYSADPRVEYAQPNYRVRLRAIPSDPLFSQLWALQNGGQVIAPVPPAPIAPYDMIDLYAPNNPPPGGGADLAVTRAWDKVTDCRGAIVAVVDSGVNFLHEDLAPNMWVSGDPTIPNPGWDFVDNDRDPTDGHGHGSHVAAIIGAVGNNGLGGVGVCWQARLMAVRAFDATGIGSDAAIIAGINFAVAHGAKVVNLSLGRPASPSGDPAFRQAIVDAGAAGAVVVAAAGNEGTDNDVSPDVPCSFTLPNLICVAALDQGYALATFSNFGATTVTVGAPGTNIASAWAGRHATIKETFTAGWSGSTTTVGGGWCLLTGTALVDPCDFGVVSYNAGTDDRAFKTLTLGPPFPLAATLDVALGGEIALGSDLLNIAFRAGATDPFAGGGTIVFTDSGSTGGVVVPLPTFDVTKCTFATSAQCTLGVRLLSAPTSPGALGVAITRFDTTVLSADLQVYALINGTSQAAPHVTGIAAMLFAFNPSYAVADVVAAVTAGGRPVPALAGKTVTGRAADAIGALSHINAPTGVTATVR